MCLSTTKKLKKELDWSESIYQVDASKTAVFLLSDRQAGHGIFTSCFQDEQDDDDDPSFFCACQEEKKNICDNKGLGLTSSFKKKKNAFRLV